MAFAIGRINSMLRIGGYRAVVSQQVRLTHAGVKHPRHISSNETLSSECRAEIAAFKALKQPKEKIAIPTPTESKYAHYDKVPNTTKSERYDKLLIIGSAPSYLDEDTCRQSWELEEELKKRTIKEK
jgi:hypothetical protein